MTLNDGVTYVNCKVSVQLDIAQVTYNRDLYPFSHKKRTAIFCIYICIYI